jgi:hypothetical protein
MNKYYYRYLKFKSCWSEIRFCHTGKKRKTPFKSKKGQICGHYISLDEIKIPLSKPGSVGIENVKLGTRN